MGALQWQREPTVLFRSGARAVLLAKTPDSAIERRVVPLRLDGSGPLVWNALASPRTAEQITLDVAQQLTEPAHDLAASVDAVIDQLHTAGLIRPARPA